MHCYKSASPFRINLFSFSFLLFMFLSNLFSFRLSFPYSNCHNRILPRSPHWKSIPTRSFPEFLPEHLEYCLFLIVFLFLLRECLHLLESISPERLGNCALYTVDQVYFSLNILPPLVEYVPLIGSVKVVIYFGNDHLHALIQPLLILILLFLNSLSLFLYLFSLSWEALLLNFHWALYVFQFHFFSLQVLLKMLDVCVQDPVLETSLHIVKLVFTHMVHILLKESLLALLRLHILFPFLKSSRFIHVIESSESVCNDSLSLSCQSIPCLT